MAPKKSIFRVVVDNDMDNSILIIDVGDFPDELGEYRDSIFAQMNGKDYYASQLVLMRGDTLVTFDFYSDLAWLNAVRRQAVEPYVERQREEVQELEYEQLRQDVIREIREERGAKPALIYHIVDHETELPIYVGESMYPDRRLQQHLTSSQILSGIPGLHAYLHQRLEEGRPLPKARIVGKTTKALAKREEQAETFRLIREGVQLLNIESVRKTTRARAMMDLKIPLEWGIDM